MDLYCLRCKKNTANKNSNATRSKQKTLVLISIFIHRKKKSRQRVVNVPYSLVVAYLKDEYILLKLKIYNMVAISDPRHTECSNLTVAR